VAQGVNRRPLTAETWFRSQVSPCEIYGGQSGIEISTCISVFSCQYRPTNTPYSSPARRINGPRLETFTKKLTRKALSCPFHVFKRSYLRKIDFYCLQKPPATKHRRHLCRSHISYSTWKEWCL